MTGTNTDSVLLDVARIGTDAVLASHKANTTSNVTLSVEATLKSLLDKSTVDRAEIAALAVGTTHFLNAIIERDSSRVERVAVLRLASFDFSSSTPPFSDWPEDLKRIVSGYSGFVPGGVNIDGKLLAPVDKEAVQEQARAIKAKGLTNVVIVGIGSPTDEKYHQEEQVRHILKETLGEDANIVCSKTIAGSGLLARENAAILNASILNFARRTIRSFIRAMRRIGLRCPLYLTSNAGHLLPFSEAMQFPIRIFSSGATNSIRGAAFLAGSNIGQSGCIVVDIGGTTTDVGFLLKNGYPRLSKTFTNLAGVKVNLEMPSVESVGLGGGSILHISTQDGSGERKVRVGPDSVGHDLLTKALCFGGETATATDVAVAGGANIGSPNPVMLPPETTTKAKARMKRMLESVIDRVKLSPEPCTVILVGGGVILCPPELKGVDKILIPEHAGVANAIGAAMAKIYGSAELMADVADAKDSLTKAMARAVEVVVRKGGDPSSVTVLNEEVNWVPYADGQRSIKVEIACPANHGKVYQEMLSSVNQKTEEAEADEETYDETKRHEAPTENEELVAMGAATVDLETYRPEVNSQGEWIISETDIKFIEIGCYLLGCGGGGSPYGSFLVLRHMLREGELIRVVRCEDLSEDDVCPSVCAVGTPAVGLERPGGALVLHAMQAMEKEVNAKFTKIVATEIGGANGLGTLIWGAKRHYNIPIVDGDLMGRAYPNFEMVSKYVHAKSVNELLPVTLCDGMGKTAVIPANQVDQLSAGKEIRKVCAEMGFACGAAGSPLSGTNMQDVGIPNSFSLAWRLGRVVAKAQRAASIATVTDALIEESGGSKSARRIFQGKIRGVASKITATAHSLGEVTIERLSDDEMETDADKVEAWSEVVVPFMNENLAVIAKNSKGEETVRIDNRITFKSRPIMLIKRFIDSGDGTRSDLSP